VGIEKRKRGERNKKSTGKGRSRNLGRELLGAKQKRVAGCLPLLRLLLLPAGGLKINKKKKEI
jgi:hypothetical protein